MTSKKINYSDEIEEVRKQDNQKKVRKQMNDENDEEVKTENYGDHQS